MFDDYIKAMKIKDLDNEFFANLCDEEVDAVNYKTYHHALNAKPISFEHYLETAYKKWIEVFFENRLIKNHTINNLVLSEVMRKLRVDKRLTITESADILGVDRTTITRYENGERQPSILYLFKFCKLYGCSMDELIEKCLY